ncbi:DNA-protecting protein DprA [Aquitalea sp. S1-19]|nr:DNA-protecting protein DprA [Aquitalea sp. S1-19]
MSEALADWAALALTPGIGPSSFLRLLACFGSASIAVRESRSSLAVCLDARQLDSWFSGEGQRAADAALAWAQGAGCSLLTLNDDDYPTRLAESDSPPPLLFARGRRELLAQDMLAIVGSRRATPQGLQTARLFAQKLGEQGYTIVSGLASGIDAAAHEGALATPASSIAVIGTGIDRVYPSSNRALAHRLAEHGLILSEFALGTGPLAGHFPQRNRILAGLARGCLVVEATLDSGSLITARLSLESGREVMAVPGSILSPQSRGCHRLIKQGARLVETVDDILEEVGTAMPADTQVPEPAAEPDVASADDPAIEALLAEMGYDAVALDTLLARLRLTAEAIYPMLLELEIQGRVASLPGGCYQRLR